MALIQQTRLKKEIELLTTDPPPGISCWLKNDDVMNAFEACIIGEEGSPYEKGRFKLDICIPDKYPFVPPVVRFVTPIYHPNIDREGRICLDIFKMPPKGAWRPFLNLSSVLVSVQQLMLEPNPDDPLVAEISNEYKYDKAKFLKQARKWTLEHAFTSMEASNAKEENSSVEMNISDSSSVKRCSEGLEHTSKKTKF